MMHTKGNDIFSFFLENHKNMFTSFNIYVTNKRSIGP